MLSRIQIFFFVLVTSSVVWANPNNNDLQLFFPNSDGMDFLSIESANQIKSSQLSLGVFMDRSTNTAPRLKTTQNQTDSSKRYSNIYDEIYHASINLAYGLSDNITLGMNLNISSESYNPNNENILYKQKAGLNDSGFSLKTLWLDYELLKSSFIFGISYDLISDNPYIDNERPWSIIAQLATTINFPLIQWGLNLGYKYRDIQYAPTLAEELIPPLKEKVFISTGLAIGESTTKILLEAYHAITSQNYSQSSDRVTSATETLIGVKFNWNAHTLYFANASEMKHGISTADNRIILGYNFRPEVTQIKQQISNKHTLDTPKEKNNKPKILYSQKPSELIPVEEKINFHVNSATILYNKETRTALRKIENYLKQNKLSELLITGHTDGSGSAEMNSKLSRERAQSVRNYLIMRGFNNINMLAIGLGDSKPIASNDHESGRQINRRVEIRAYKSVRLSH